MLKKLLIAASLLTSTSVFAATTPITFSQVIDPDQAASFAANTYAYETLDTSSILPGTYFNLTGAVSVNNLTGKPSDNKPLVNVALFDISNNSIVGAAQSPTAINDSYSFSFFNLSAGTNYQLRFNIASGSFTNKTSAPVRDISGSYSLSAVTVTTPVPEPETYGMMFAGLALMALIVFRRQRNS